MVKYTGIAAINHNIEVRIICKWKVPEILIQNQSRCTVLFTFYLITLHLWSIIGRGDKQAWLSVYKYAPPSNSSTYYDTLNRRKIFSYCIRPLFQRTYVTTTTLLLFKQKWNLDIKNIEKKEPTKVGRQPGVSHWLRGIVRSRPRYDAGRTKPASPLNPGTMRVWAMKGQGHRASCLIAYDKRIYIVCQYLGNIHMLHSFYEPIIISNSRVCFLFKVKVDFEMTSWAWCCQKMARKLSKWNYTILSFIMKYVNFIISIIIFWRFRFNNYDKYWKGFTVNAPLERYLANVAHTG